LRLRLAVPGRREGLPLEIWAAAAQRRPSQPWVLMMPGLGGNADQLGWLARVLAQRGWPVVVVQHPGSDGLAVRAAFNGQRPPPGAETLGIRLADVEAVVAAQRQGKLPVNGSGLVLAGHSLGGLTALLAAGIAPLPGLEGRCRTALERLPIHNPSRLIQCQLPERSLPRPSRPPADLRGLILFNGFGSLLWPEPGLGGLPVPLLMVGGSLDLVTPPLDEQLALFLAVRDPRSRLVVVHGASHFSPVRMAERDEALLRLGRELVGVDPLRVQAVLLDVTSAFLSSLEQSGAEGGAAARSPAEPLPPQRRLQEGIKAYVLDPAAARLWRSEL
jgi:predicted dienelactone hydrolase